MGAVDSWTIKYKNEKEVISYENVAKAASDRADYDQALATMIRPYRSVKLRGVRIIGGL